MNFVSFESQEKLFYQLETNHVEYQKALIHNGYAQEDNTFQKEFPSQFPHKEKTINNLHMRLIKITSLSLLHPDTERIPSGSTV